MAVEQQVRAASTASAALAQRTAAPTMTAAASACAPAATVSATALTGVGASVSPSPAKSEHLSAADEAAIRLLPGNDRCVDCKAIFPQWAAVSFGVLVCLACAGKHRSLGVGASFVKSLGMDSWSATERRSLMVGGNAKWTAVCFATATSDLPLASKYTSSVAEAYRRRVQLAAASGESPDALTASAFLASLAPATSPAESADGMSLPPGLATPPSAAPSLPLPPPAPSTAAPSADALSVKCTTCQLAVPLEHLDSHSNACVVGSSSPSSWRKYECELGAAGQALGISLTRTRGGFAEVTRVTPGGEAERLGVAVGSFVVGLNDAQTAAFEEIVALVRALPRPIRFRFACRRARESAGVAGVAAAAVVSSVPEPVSVDVELTFDEKELGCALQVRGHTCVVQHVDKGGAAHARGVLVGSRIVEVNGRRFLKPEEVIHAIQTSRRPMRLRFHRVEGLVRAWTRR